MPFRTVKDRLEYAEAALGASTRALDEARKIQGKLWQQYDRDLAVVQLLRNDLQKELANDADALIQAAAKAYDQGGRRSDDNLEKVNHPQHYGGDVEHEVIKCLSAWGLEKDALLWNAVKYIARFDKKDDALTNLKKAQFYLNRRIEELGKRHE